jgi:hypothetical protein
MNVNKRLSDLENETGGGDDPTAVIVNWEKGDPDPAQVIRLSNGVRMTYAEYQRRFPKAETKTVSWDDLED